MKRLIIGNTDETINGKVLEYFGLEYCGQGNIANPDQHSATFIMHEIIRVVKETHPDFEYDLVHQFAAVIMRYVMHLQPDIALSVTRYENDLSFYHQVVDFLRDKYTKLYADSTMKNEDIYPIIVRIMLGRLEHLFF